MIWASQLEDPNTARTCLIWPLVSWKDRIRQPAMVRTRSDAHKRHFKIAPSQKLLSHLSAQIFTFLLFDSRDIQPNELGPLSPPLTAICRSIELESSTRARILLPYAKDDVLVNYWIIEPAVHWR